jgi:hypothetical protein
MGNERKEMKAIDLLKAVLLFVVVLIIATPANNRGNPVPEPAYVECDGSATCPEHNAISAYIGTRKEVWDFKKAEYCTYGLYSHWVTDTNEKGGGHNHKFWNLCGCP